MFYLTTHSTHFIYGYMASDIWLRTILIVDYLQAQISSLTSAINICYNSKQNVLIHWQYIYIYIYIYDNSTM